MFSILLKGHILFYQLLFFITNSIYCIYVFTFNLFTDNISCTIFLPSFHSLTPLPSHPFPRPQLPHSVSLTSACSISASLTSAAFPPLSPLSSLLIFLLTLSLTLFPLLLFSLSFSISSFQMFIHSYLNRTLLLELTATSKNSIVSFLSSSLLLSKTLRYFTTSMQQQRVAAPRSSITTILQKQGSLRSFMAGNLDGRVNSMRWPNAILFGDSITQVK